VWLVRSCLYEGHVEHDRAVGRGNRFRYAMYMWLVDLAELDELDRSLRLLGVERPGVSSIRSGDHLGDPHRPIRENLAAFMAAQGVELGDRRVTLLTNARVFGHVFNPLSVFYCEGADGRIDHVVAEVCNTHGERHCYLVQPGPDGQCETTKAFYVSPFLRVEGGYRMSVPAPGERLAVRIELVQAGRRVFAAGLTGERRPLSDAGLLRMLVRHPLMTQQVSGLIRLQGIRLWARRSGHVRHRPHTPQRGVV